MTQSDDSIPKHSIKKRKLTDYFITSTKTFKNRPSPSQSPSKYKIPGLSLLEDFITSHEEADILSFLNSDNCIWRTDLSRKTMHFGGEYCLMPSKVSNSPSKEDRITEVKPQIIQAPPMPQEFNWLIQRMIDKKIYPENCRPQYCIVNRYINDLGISAHTEKFSFSQPVVGLSLLDSCPMRFHELVAPDGGSVRSGKAQRAERTGRRIDVILPGKSLVVMNDDARWKWQHEIMRTSKGRGPKWERVSLTFRHKG